MRALHINDSVRVILTEDGARMATRAHLLTDRKVFKKDDEYCCQLHTLMKVFGDQIVAGTAPFEGDIVCTHS